MSDEFVEGTKLTVSWDKSIKPVREMERELKMLFARYGLEFCASGCDLFEYSRKLIFEVPVKKAHRVVIHWSGLAHMDLERSLEQLLGAFGYTCTGKTREADDEDLELVFRQPV